MIDTLLIAGKWALTLVAVSSIAAVIFQERKNLAFVPMIARRFTFSMFAQCFGVFLATVATAVLLIECVPGMRYGWLHLFLPQGGNVLISPVLDASSSDLKTARLLPPVFLICLALAVPFLAYAEERMFRSGYHDWASIRRQSIKFGLVHCIVGVPLGAGVALILTGLFYGHKYRKAFVKSPHWNERYDWGAADREATLVSTAYHSMYNLIAVSILITMTTLILFLSK